MTVTAGAHDVVATFLNQTAALDETPRLPFLRPFPAGNNVPETRLGASLRSVEISGPHGTAVTGDSASRRRIFVCQPGASEGGAVRCSNTILRTLARRALSSSGDRRRRSSRCSNCTARGASQGGFEAGIERALRRLLVSPEFLYRVEVDPPNLPRGQRLYASAISSSRRVCLFSCGAAFPTMSCSRPPSAANCSKPAVLRTAGAAHAGRPPLRGADRQLRWPVAVPAQRAGLTARRRACSRISTTTCARRSAARPSSSSTASSRGPQCARSARADYTFLNERLARALRHSAPSRAALPALHVAAGRASARGLLGQGSILTVTSYPDRTSPVVRGKWILENILGTPPPPPLPTSAI